MPTGPGRPTEPAISVAGSGTFGLDDTGIRPLVGGNIGPMMIV